MLIKAKIENHNEWLFLEEIPEKYIHNHRLSEREINIRHSPVHMRNYQLSTNGLFLLHSEMSFNQKVRIETEVEGDAIASQFIFVKDRAGSKTKPRYGRSRHNIRYIPAQKESYEVKADTDYIYFLIVLSKDYYLNLVDVSSPLQEGFIHEMEKGVFSSFMDEDLYVTPEMRTSIESIRECKQDGDLKRMFTDARILELIMYQLEQFSQYIQDEKEILQGTDIEKLEHVREILESNFIDPPAQKELARIALLNESKLRTGFKKYFGTTIYDFVTRLRMVEARRLIVEEKKNNMYEIGNLVGFKHQASFTNAFKRYYGMPPSEVRL
ncbi:helix-turn-helix domain-containing protein [Sphingobacterium sp. JB170]|uniref:helix-turn-helix domain-containing protein n=1 Tax=Sphingobacterium sp. JB170 TaxID=1434842 RepID=UPI00097F45A3|nr:helix-turn-helix domain-containing protein [Sphingobacterium sp. JB170]SJN22924.1 Transcriptional regulator, AraC family [Sphingobacterium sp. JB170]